MTKKQKWKAFGKNTGQSFKNFGLAMAQTAKIVVGKEENDVEDNGKTKLRNAWTKTGKGFGKAGSSLGTAAAGTFKFSKEDNQEEVDAEPKEESKEEQPEEEIKEIELKDQQ